MAFSLKLGVCLDRSPASSTVAFPALTQEEHNKTGGERGGGAVLPGALLLRNTILSVHSDVSLSRWWLLLNEQVGGDV